MCHRNAFYLAGEHPDELVMVNGYARGESGPWIGHWWCADKAGNVIDPTWKNTGSAYVGLSVETVEAYAKRTVERGCWEVELPDLAPSDLWPALERAAA